MFRNGKFVYINQTFANLFKVPIQEIEGKDFDLLFHDLTDEETKKSFFFGEQMKWTGLKKTATPPIPPYQMKNKLESLRKNSLNSFSRSVFIPKLRSRSTSGPMNQKLNKQKEKKIFNEFTAVLSDKMGKVMTCRVVIIPTATSIVKLIGSKNIHFTICLHKLFEKMSILSFPSDVIKNENVGSSNRPFREQIHDGLEPLNFEEKQSTDFSFLSPEVFPLKAIIPTDNILWD